MTEIGAYTPQDAREIKRRVLNSNRTIKNLLDHTDRDKLGWHYGILKEELLPVCDPLTEYTQATAAVVMYTEGLDSLDMEEVTPEELYVTLTNRSPYLSYGIGDIVLFRWVIKEWAIVNAPIKRVQGVLQTDLPAALDVRDDPGTGLAKILVKNAAGDLKLTTTEITIINRCLNISVLSGTYCKFEWIDCEWQPYVADCPGDFSFSSSQEGSSCT